MYRISMFAFWFFICLGMTFLLLMPLAVPDSLFADSGGDGPCCKGPHPGCPKSLPCQDGPDTNCNFCTICCISAP